MVRPLLLLLLLIPFATALGAISQRHDGAWFNPQTPGQGLMVDVLTDERAFLAWFTFEAAPSAKLGAPEQRWLTGEGSIDGDEISLTLYLTEGGVFDAAAATTTTAVGSAMLRFAGCTAGRFEYQLDGGRSGAFDLVRIGGVGNCEPPGPERTIPAEVEAASPTAFIGVSIIPMTDESPAVVSNQDVLIRDGTIEAIGPSGSVPFPASTAEIVAPGAFLMPGMADTHTHLATNMAEFLNLLPPERLLDEMADDQLTLYLANGVTTLFNLGDFGEPLPRWSREVRQGLRIGPVIYAAQYARGPPGTPDGGPTGRFVRSATDAPGFVRAARQAGYQLMKIYNYTPADAVHALVDEAAVRGMPVAGHIPQTVDGLSFLRSGELDLLAHAEAYTWSIFGWGQRPEDLPSAIDATLAGGVWLTTTLGIVEMIAQVWCGDPSGIEAFWDLPEVAWMSDTEVRLHDEGITGPRWNPGGCARGAYDPQVPYMYLLLREMHAAGVPLLLGTDSPTVLGAAGFSAHRELEALARAGLENADILRIATRNPGDFISREYAQGERFGRIAPGYRADLILLGENPLDDVSRVGDARLGVMALGHWRSGGLLDALLEEIRRDREGVQVPGR